MAGSQYLIRERGPEMFQNNPDHHFFARMFRISAVSGDTRICDLQKKQLTKSSDIPCNCFSKVYFSLRAPLANDTLAEDPQNLHGYAYGSSCASTGTL